MAMPTPAYIVKIFDTKFATNADGARVQWIYVDDFTGLIGTDDNISSKVFIDGSVFENIRDILPFIDIMTKSANSGLFDKNGKKIFENHIVSLGDHTYKVGFELGSFILIDDEGLMIEKIGGEVDHCYPLFDLFLKYQYDEAVNDVTIIGHMYDKTSTRKDGKYE